MSLPYNGNKIAFAKELRKNATKQENHLWYDFLNKYPIRFQRQKTISEYIVDFFCAKANLVIEIDGSQHYTDEGLKYDENRTKVLESYNLKVIRFSNLDIDRNFDGVCEQINYEVKERMKCHD